jgi:hypothetical protein
MNRKERQELRHIAAWLKTIRVELPTEPMDLMLHASFYEWAINVLEGKRPGAPKKGEPPRVTFLKMMERYHVARASLIAEGHENPSLTKIFERMRGGFAQSDDATRKSWDRAQRAALSDPLFLAACEEVVAGEQAKQPWRWQPSDDSLNPDDPAAQIAKRHFEEAQGSLIAELREIIAELRK